MNYPATVNTSRLHTSLNISCNNCPNICLGNNLTKFGLNAVLLYTTFRAKETCSTVTLTAARLTTNGLRNGNTRYPYIKLYVSFLKSSLKENASEMVIYIY